MKKGTIRYIWECTACNDIVISYSHLTHEMNSCDKGCSSVDLEEDYHRVIGEIEVVSTKEWDGKKWVRPKD